MSDKNEATAVSADEELKRAQAAKLRRELELLPASRWNLDTLSKPLIAVIAVLGTVLAFAANIPQNEWKALEAEKKRLEAQKRFDADSEQHSRTLASWREEVQTLQTQASRFQLELQERSVKVPASSVTPPVVAPPVKPRVFIQFSGNVTRSTVNGLRKVLNDGAFVAPEAERISTAPNRNQVRYFVDNPAERERAQKLAEITAKYFAEQGCPLREPIEARRLEAERASPLEVWIQHDCKA